MTTGFYSDQQPFDKGLCKAIVENAREALGLPMVQLCGFAPDFGQVHCLASSTSRAQRIQRGLAAIRSRFPEFDIERITVGVRANSLITQLYLEGQTVTAAVEQIARGVVDEEILAYAPVVVGLRHVLACPVIVQGRVYGALVFLHERAFTRGRRSACEAFVRQVVITLEQVLLLDELQRSRVYLTEAEERLRRSVAEFLHGRVQSQLLVVWHRLDEAIELITRDPDAARSLIENARQIIDRVREEDVRRVSHELHPSIIQIGLVPALRSLIATYGRRLKVHLEVDEKVCELDDPLQNRIPEQVRLALYRVVEEGLINALRHARASEAQVILAAHPELKNLEVRVCDNGTGLCEKLPRMGLGLASIDARISPLGGEWSLGENPDGATGTTLWARIPLKPVESEPSAD